MRYGQWTWGVTVEAIRVVKSQAYLHTSSAFTPTAGTPVGAQNLGPGQPRKIHPILVEHHLVLPHSGSNSFFACLMLTMGLVVAFVGHRFVMNYLSTLSLRLIPVLLLAPVHFACVQRDDPSISPAMQLWDSFSILKSCRGDTGSPPIEFIRH